MTARSDLHAALDDGDGRPESQLLAAELIDAHAAEVRAATLAEADAALTAAIERDRAQFLARSSDRAALGAAREIIRNLDAPADRPADDTQQQDTP